MTVATVLLAVATLFAGIAVFAARAGSSPEASSPASSSPTSESSMPTSTQLNQIEGEPCSGSSLNDTVLDDTAPSLDGLSEPIIETVTAIDIAAASCDWTTLADLIDEDFEVGDVHAVHYAEQERLLTDSAVVVQDWRDDERSGSTPMLTLRRLLRAPYALGDPVSEPAEAVWPSIRARVGCDSVSPEEWAWFAGWLERPIVELQAECEAHFADELVYWHDRVEIDGSGRWQYWVTGIIT